MVRRRYRRHEEGNRRRYRNAEYGKHYRTERPFTERRQFRRLAQAQADRRQQSEWQCVHQALEQEYTATELAEEAVKYEDHTDRKGREPSARALDEGALLRLVAFLSEQPLYHLFLFDVVEE